MTRTSVYLSALLLASICTLSSCSSPADDLDSQVSDALSDNAIDVSEADALRVYVGRKSRELGDDDKTKAIVLPDGKIDESALMAFVKRNKTYRKLAREGKTPSVSLSGGAVATTKPISLKLYLEASGSMFPYDAPGGNGTFKRTLNDLLTEFDATNAGQGKIYVVNTEINPLGLSLSQFFKERNIFTIAKTKGKTTSTDFEKIFKTILSETTGNDLSVLVSDLIYSDPALAGMSAQKTLDAASSLLSTVFNPYVNTHSMLVLKLDADFDGTYYSWNNAKHPYKGDRPYYLCLIGRNEVMQQLYTSPNYAQIRRFDQLPGFSDAWFFGKINGSAAPAYTVLVNDPAKKGRFKRSADEVRERAKAVHAITDVQPEVSDKSLTIPVAVDLSALHLPASVLTDVSQYVVDGKDNFKVSSVQPYQGANGMTHKLLLTTDRPSRGDRTASIRLRRQFPPRWIANTTTTNDAKPDANSTFGLENLLQGVDRAYNPNNQPDYFTLVINLE
jgi:hypothetical protein